MQVLKIECREWSGTYTGNAARPSFSDLPHIGDAPTITVMGELFLANKPLFVKCRDRLHDWPMHQVPSRAYLATPLFAPTLHVFLTPIWQILGWASRRCSFCHGLASNRLVLSSGRLPRKRVLYFGCSATHRCSN